MTNHELKAGLSGSGFLGGQFLIAMPNMRDPRFERSVVLLCSHSRQGAMGIVINKAGGDICFADLAEQLDLLDEDKMPQMPDHVGATPVHVGGPVDVNRGFVLHSEDFSCPDSTLAVGDRLCLTATPDILRAIALEQGPAHNFLALGYAGWAPGQLEHELSANAWLHCPADPAIIFKTRLEERYDRALALLGIDPAFLVADSGHA